MPLRQRLVDFLESKTGVLLLGFLLTTVGGSMLNTAIQQRSALNQRIAELERERFRQGTQLQTELIDSSNARVYTLSQLVGQIAHPRDWSVEFNEKYWHDRVEPAKDLWNERRYYFHAQARTLFSSELASLVYRTDEDATKANDDDPETLDAAAFALHKPKSLHGALKQLHATAYRLKQKCRLDPNCASAPLVELADAQTAHAELMQRCVLYRLSAELLRFPSESLQAAHAISGDVPAECQGVDSK